MADRVAPQPTAEVVAVASAQRLGAPTGSLVSTKFNVWLGTRSNQNFLYLFEQGLVRVPARGQQSAAAPEACCWDDLSVTQTGATQHFRNGIYQRTTYFVSLRRADGSVMDFSGVFRDPAKARLNTASSAGDRHLYNLLQKVCVSVANRRFPASLEALNNGQQLTFGPIVLTREGITTKKGFVSWSAVRTVDVAAGAVLSHNGG